MSSLKLNSLLTSVFLAMFIAMGGSAMAQDGLRLWKPYNPESFGGGRRSNDGVYGSISGIYWSFSTPEGGYIGATTASGSDETRWVYSGYGLGKVYAQTNSVKINMMSPTTTLGTRFEVGNRRGHHGWLVSGYGLPSQTHRMTVHNASMAIRDEGNLTFQPSAFSEGFFGGMELARLIFVWDSAHNSLFDPTAPANSRYYPFADWQMVDNLSGPSTISGIGYLWGYFPHRLSSDGDIPEAVFAPLPIWFANADIITRTTHMSAELMYTYRAHPFTWGSMELLAGARYWDFDDKFGFLGSGPRGTSRNINTVDEDSNTNNANNANNANNNNNNNNTNNATGNNNDTYGPLSVLADMTVNAKGINRVFGPQVGMKLSRQNARWTFGAEGRFMAGINTQSLTTEGYIATNYDFSASNAETLGPSGHDVDAYTAKWVPVGLQYGNTNFGHKQNKTYFSPILELRLSADWQWTEAVSFFGAFDSMYAGNIARGVRITDYVVHSDGTIFGIRGDNHNTDVIVYGFEVGIKVRR